MKLVKDKKRFQGLTGDQILDLVGNEGYISSFVLFRMPDGIPYRVRLISGVAVVSSLDLSHIVARVIL